MITPASEFIAHAQMKCHCLDATEAKKLFDEIDGAIILDVREPKEAEESHIEGSINIPRGLIEMKIQNHCTEPSTTILVHCGGGGRASLAAARLQEMGYHNVYAITAKYDALKVLFK